MRVRTWHRHRRLSAWLLLSLTVLMRTAASGQDTPPIDVTGSWALAIEMPFGPSVSTVTLRQTGSALTGEYSSSSLGDHAAEGRIVGRRVELTFRFKRNPPSPEETTVVLSGTVTDAHTFGGEITITPGRTGTFTATRRVEGTASTTAVEWPDPSPHRRTMVPVDRDVSLEVLDWGGTGRPLVLLAGQGNTAHVYDDFAPRLRSLGHVYGITRRGSGRSSLPRTGYNGERLADDVVAVLDTLHLEGPVLIGHSMAGEELTSIAVRYSRRARALVYLDSAGDRTAFYPELVAARMAIPQPNPSPQNRASIAAFQAWQRATLGIAMPESELREILVVGTDGRVGTFRTPGWVFEAQDAGFKRPEYSRFEIPALSIQAMPPPSVADARRLQLWVPGRWPNVESVTENAVNLLFSLERRILREQAIAFERGVKDARNVEITGANHHLFLSHPEEVFKEMQMFIERFR